MVGIGASDGPGGGSGMSIGVHDEEASRAEFPLEFSIGDISTVSETSCLLFGSEAISHLSRKRGMAGVWASWKWRLAYQGLVARIKGVVFVFLMALS